MNVSPADDGAFVQGEQHKGDGSTATVTLDRPIAKAGRNRVRVLNQPKEFVITYEQAAPPLREPS